METPENGRTVNSPTHQVGTTIRYACNEGYAMSGDSAMLCRIDGEWYPSTPPTCTARDCGEFGSIQHADVFQDNSFTERNHYGSVVHVTCDEGKTLVGSPTVECQSDGQWGARPTCVVLQCPPYPNTNSPCMSNSGMFDDYLYIHCDDAIATRFGPELAECVSGQWDTTDMGCLCDCIIPEPNSNFVTFTNLNSHDNLAHATALEWTCNTGTSKHPSVNVVCIDGQLRVEENDNVIILANYTSPIDINEIIHAICILTSTTSTTTPTTLTSTTTPTSLTSTRTQTSLTSTTIETSLTSTIKQTSIRHTPDDNSNSTINTVLNNTTTKNSDNSKLYDISTTEHSIEKLNSGAFCLGCACSMYLCFIHFWFLKIYY